MPDDYTVEVQLHLSGAHATQTFDQAGWFVFSLASLDHLLELRTRWNREGRLIDRLVPCIELRHNEMARGAKGQHARSIGVMIGTESAKTGKQTVVQIDDSATGKFPTSIRGQHSHVPRQNDVVDAELVDNAHYRLIIRGTIFSADELKGNTELLG